jgi:hypothetical protein
MEVEVFPGESVPAAGRMTASKNGPTPLPTIIFHPENYPR